MYMDLLINKNNYEFHLVMFHMQSTYLLKLAVCLRLSYSLFVSPLSVHLGQTRQQVLRFRRAKYFWTVKTAIFIKKFSGRNKIWKGTKNLRWIALECPLWLQA